MNGRSIVIAGGGAAGFFAAITCAETAPGAGIVLLERSPRFLSKVRISGGGRCNVTHACFEPRRLRDYYPRGGNELMGPFQRFQPRDTFEWFRSRGVELKTEQDGRVFPVTDSSQTIIDCLIREAEQNSVLLRANTGLISVIPNGQAGFQLLTTAGDKLHCQRLMLATGGCRAASAGQLAVSLGHKLQAPVPSLFTFHIELAWLKELAGISVPNVELSSSIFGLRESGALLITHSGLSG